MVKKLPDNFREVIAGGSKSEFWKALKLYIENEGNTDKFLAIKNEMGIKGFWYMKGFCQAMNQIIRTVESLKQQAEKKENDATPLE